jgi:glycogen debranching enzyme
VGRKRVCKGPQRMSAVGRGMGRVHERMSWMDAGTEEAKNEGGPKKTRTLRALEGLLLLLTW